MLHALLELTCPSTRGRHGFVRYARRGTVRSLRGQGRGGWLWSAISDRERRDGARL